MSIGTYEAQIMIISDKLEQGLKDLKYREDRGALRMLNLKANGL